MTSSNRRRIYDIGERVAWTFVQGGLGVISTEQLDIPIAWAPVIAAALSATKGWVATKVGNTRTASTLPAEFDPAVGSAQ
jgi:hypothetical protein